MRIAFVLPGLHRVNRGAEVAFESIASEMARLPGIEVTLIGSGRRRAGAAYRFIHAGCVPRGHFAKWPAMPCLRDDCMYEELTFVPGLFRAYRPAEFDLTVACSYPYTNWLLRFRGAPARRPAHVFVTQNGDWPVRAGHREYRWFSCDGLVCTNPEFHERNRDRWRSALIPNGVDPDLYSPGPSRRAELGLPRDVRIVLMVSALIPGKRVIEGIRGVAALKDVHLVVAGDGPLRAQVQEAGRALMGERFQNRTFAREQMPALYRSVDAFLHMCIEESSANAYIEALASAVPIATHYSFVTRWTLEDEASYADTRDEAAVVAAVERALGRGRTTGPEIVKRRFTWAAIARQYAEFFDDVLARRREGAAKDESAVEMRT